jgi:plasmid stabilization system protein ParE
MIVVYTRQAKDELKEAVEFYNSERAGLGFEFANEVRRTVQRVKEYPEAWTKLSENSRRARCRRFPFGIIYSFDSRSITILAVMHMKRKPGYWKGREIN